MGDILTSPTRPRTLSLRSSISAKYGGLDGEGRFVEKIESTKGVLVNNDIIEYLEFYYQGGNSDEEQQAKGPRRERVSRA